MCPHTLLEDKVDVDIFRGETLSSRLVLNPTQLYD